MRVIYQRCCGIDVHKKMIVACLLIWTAQGVQKEIRTESHDAIDRGCLITTCDGVFSEDSRWHLSRLDRRNLKGAPHSGSKKFDASLRQRS